MSSGELAVRWALRLFRTLHANGVREVQVCPGSRSTPLVLAADLVPDLRLRVHLDERSAAFFALGYGRRRRVPSAVITTSGTAVANLVPAAVEALHSEVPLILVTADRPEALRNTDANQTTDHLRILSGVVRWQCELPLPRVADRGLDRVAEATALAVRESTVDPSGPVHLNVPFDKPLQPDAVADLAGLMDEGWVPPMVAPNRTGPASVDGLRRLIGHARRPLLVAGRLPDPDRQGPAIASFASEAGIPLFADPLSGARFTGVSSGVAIPSYDHLLGVSRVREDMRPDLVIQCGRAPTSGWLDRYLTGLGGDVPRVTLTGAGTWTDQHGLTGTYVRHDPAEVLAAISTSSVDPAWLDRWRDLDALAWEAIDEGSRLPGNEGAVASAALAGVPAGGTLFVSSSMPVRDVDGYGRPTDRHVRVLGNRGVSGIDGIVSSVLGVAAAGSEPLVGLVGDLALLHDSNGLFAARYTRGGVVLVVVDNDGGGIFHMLPIRDFEPAFTPYFATPHGLDLARAAELYGLEMRDVDAAGDLTDAVADALREDGVRILRIRTNRDVNLRRHQETRALVERRVVDYLSNGSRGD